MQPPLHQTFTFCFFLRYMVSLNFQSPVDSADEQFISTRYRHRYHRWFQITQYINKKKHWYCPPLINDAIETQSH